MTRFEVRCFTCNGPIDFLHGDPTWPCCAGCGLGGDQCDCPVGPELNAKAAAEDREPEKYPPPPPDEAKAQGLLRTPLLRWLRGSMTRRMFARALGDRIPDSRSGPQASIVGGDNPTYLRMATQILDHVALELTKKPWADPTYPEAVAAERLTPEDVLDACQSAGVHLVRFRDWNETDDGKWYRRGNEEAELAAALAGAAA